MLEQNFIEECTEFHISKFDKEHDEAQ